MILQVCPTDHPPFTDLCRVYQAAAQAIGQTCQTLILGPPHAAAAPDFTYLDVANKRQTRRLVAQFRQAVGDTRFDVAICHRYRAYHTARAANVQARHRIVVAHEFGMLARFSRRLTARFDSRTVFAGVSPSVVAELSEQVDNTALWPNALDVQAFREELYDRDEARRRLELDAGRKIIGVVGRLHPKKRPHLALAAMPFLPEYQLAFVGEGQEAEALRQAADERVHFCGFVRDARRYLRAFDVLLIPAAEVEAFGMVALEALAARVPVVCARMPGPEYVLGEAASYFQTDRGEEIADGIRTASSLAASRTDRAVELFSVSAVGERLRTLVQS